MEDKWFAIMVIVFIVLGLGAPIAVTVSRDNARARAIEACYRAHEPNCARMFP